MRRLAIALSLAWLWGTDRCHAADIGAAIGWCFRLSLAARETAGHKIAGHVSGEKTLQCKKPGSVDVACVEAQKQRKRR